MQFIADSSQIIARLIMHIVRVVIRLFISKPPDDEPDA